MGEGSLVERWPGRAAAIVVRLREGRVEVAARDGAVDELRAWASVSKMVVSLAMGVEFEEGRHRPDEVVGPHGVTIAALLSHASGLGLEEGDPVVAPETKRVYSNYAVDYLVRVVVGEGDPASWLDRRVLGPLGMRDSRLEGRPAAGVMGSTSDLATLAAAWLRPDLVGVATRDRLRTPYRDDLDGIVPGFGRFSPCPWGLGPEVRGTKRHWMGDWPADSFGHFGQSGALILLNAHEQIGVVATSTEPFGRWAVDLWPDWISEMRQRALA
ncbi:MAG: serine hydrolase [Acidimicrobiales bacterium]